MKLIKRRWFRFGLLSFLLFITAFCLWLGWHVEQARRQREAVAWVQEMGGKVQYEYEYAKNGKREANPQPPGPKWLRQLFGIDFWDEVVFIYIHNERMSDITRLARLTSLKHLNLDNTQVRDVAPLAGLTNLNWLSLYGTEVKDVTPLAKVGNLRKLDLGDTQVKDVKPLSGLKQLRELHLILTQVSQEDVEMLQEALPDCGITR